MLEPCKFHHRQFKISIDVHMHVFLGRIKHVTPCQPCSTCLLQMVAAPMSRDLHRCACLNIWAWQCPESGAGWAWQCSESGAPERGAG